jgi:hypothetical protein
MNGLPVFEYAEGEDGPRVPQTVLNAAWAVPTGFSVGLKGDGTVVMETPALEPVGDWRAENPKDAAARASNKPRLDLLEPVAERQIAGALAFGAAKYGVRNYVKAPIAARVYVAAMKRHIDAWLEGEDVAEDSAVHHLAHVGANVHVALAAMEAGTFIDDRAGDVATDSSEKPEEVAA